MYAACSRKKKNLYSLVDPSRGVSRNQSSYVCKYLKMQAGQPVHREVRMTNNLLAPIPIYQCKAIQSSKTLQTSMNLRAELLLDAIEFGHVSEDCLLGRHGSRLEGCTKRHQKVSCFGVNFNRVVRF
jgi:hypothetical protein